MATLVLGMKEGDEFQVGHHCMAVDQIFSDHEFRLRHSSGIYLHIRDEPTNVAAGIWIRSGTRGQRHLARVCIEADSTVPIRRLTEPAQPSAIPAAALAANQPHSPSAPTTPTNRRAPG